MAAPLFPDPAGPPRLLAEVTGIFAGVPFVRSLAVFGSLAEGRADRWSDVDLLVECDDGARCPWLAAGALRQAKPVLFYRKFSLVEQPSGRYWFAGESLFHRLDVSFHSPEEMAGRQRTHEARGWVVRPLAVPACRPMRSDPVVAVPLAISEREAEIGLWLYRTLNALQAHLRHGGRATELQAAAAGLRTSLAGIERDAVMAGGRIGELAYRVLAMAGECARR